MLRQPEKKDYDQPSSSSTAITMQTFPSAPPLYRQEDFQMRAEPVAAPAPTLNEVKIEDIIVRSTLANPDSEKQWEDVVREFNRAADVKSCFTTSLVRGEWINRDEFVLGHRNKKPELAPFNPQYRIARALTADPTAISEIISTVKQNEKFYGAHGTYVLNVPVNQIAKAFSGNTPKIYGPGPHVIHDQNFRFDLQTGFVDMNTHHINHGNINIIMVPTGKIALVTVDNQPFFLDSRQKPYVFQTPFFQLHTRTINNTTTYFYNSTDRLIVHGSKKRVMPHTSEVAISYNNGQLEIISPRSNNQPTYIDSSEHEVLPNFLNTSIETLVFPSDETRKQRLRDNPKATTDELSYEIFTTKDSLKVGVKLLVAYRIKDPDKALRLLGDQAGILKHIENLATVDMGKAIQKCTSQEFLSFKTQRDNQPQDLLTDSGRNYQDDVKDQFSKDLAEYGLELVRLNFETPKIMDPEIAKKLSEQSLKTADANASEGVLEQQYTIARRNAEKEAETRRIQQQQVNNARISEAETELEAAKKQAEAIKIRAEAEKQAMIIRAEGEKAAASLRGQQFAEHPGLYELEKFRIQMEAFSKAQFIPPQMMNAFMNPGQSFFGGMPMTMFAQPAPAALPAAPTADEGKVVHMLGK